VVVESFTLQIKSVTWVVYLLSFHADASRRRRADKLAGESRSVAAVTATTSVAERDTLITDAPDDYRQVLRYFSSCSLGLSGVNETFSKTKTLHQRSNVTHHAKWIVTKNNRKIRPTIQQFCIHVTFSYILFFHNTV